MTNYQSYKQTFVLTKKLFVFQRNIIQKSFFHSKLADIFEH